MKSKQHLRRPWLPCKKQALDFGYGWGQRSPLDSNSIWTHFLPVMAEKYAYDPDRRKPPSCTRGGFEFDILEEPEIHMATVPHMSGLRSIPSPWSTTSSSPTARLLFRMKRRRINSFSWSSESRERSATGTELP